MTLRLFDTYTYSLRDFVPLRPPEVSLYTCGPSQAYDEPHGCGSPGIGRRHRRRQVGGSGDDEAASGVAFHRLPGVGLVTSAGEAIGWGARCHQVGDAQSTLILAMSEAQKERSIAEETTDAFWNLDGNADANGQATRRSRALVTAAGK